VTGTAGRVDRMSGVPVPWAPPGAVAFAASTAPRRPLAVIHDADTRQPAPPVGGGSTPTMALPPAMPPDGSAVMPPVRRDHTAPDPPHRTRHHPPRPLQTAHPSPSKPRYPVAHVGGGWTPTVALPPAMPRWISRHAAGTPGSHGIRSAASNTPPSAAPVSNGPSITQQAPVPRGARRGAGPRLWPIRPQCAPMDQPSCRRYARITRHPIRRIEHVTTRRARFKRRIHDAASPGNRWRT